MSMVCIVRVKGQCIKLIVPSTTGPVRQVALAKDDKRLAWLNSEAGQLSDGAVGFAWKSSRLRRVLFAMGFGRR